MSEKLARAPVYYTLAQARFNPVAKMAAYVDEIQERFRREGFTAFDALQSTQLQFGPSGDNASQGAQLVPVPSWLFSRSDRSAGFILTTTFVSFHTTHYDTHEGFQPELLRGLGLVHAAVGLDHVARLGLRYLNAVWPEEGETVDRYLVPGLHGIDAPHPLRYAMHESVFDTQTRPLLLQGTLVVRVYRTTSPLGYPPDLIPNGLLPQPKFQPKEVRSHAVLDLDHAVEGLVPLDFAKIGEQMQDLHDTLSGAFLAATTEYAHSVWR